MKPCTFYALICGTSVYVAHAISITARTLFLAHYEEQRHSTSVAVNQLRASQGVPGFFHLESVELSNRKDLAARRAAWETHFVEAGYTPISGTARHAEQLSDTAAAHYTAIRHHDLASLCAPELDLAPRILAARQGPREQREERTVRVRIPAARYQALRQYASSRGLRIETFLLLCAQEHPPAQVDLRVVLDCTQTSRQVLTLLQAIVADAQRTHIYDSDALAQAAAAVADLSIALRQVNQRLRSLCTELRNHAASGQ